MALFQQTVLKKYIESLDSNKIDQQWEKFKSIFHNVEKQNNIRNSKEEQFQEGFLRELFVGVLGYTINPDENFNLLTELKNVANSKKADGAILIEGKAVAVIELKGTETTDLNKIEVQAFGYKNNQHNCTYVITSNFEKIRFYIENTIQQEEFNLFTLNKERFQLLYTCLSWESISKNIPIQILNESVSKENKITKDLYKDYSEFKRELFSSLVGLNPQYDKLLLFKKSQKLLDRFLFIFFAEDTSLLPTNLIFRINTEWQNLVASRVPVSLYDRYKMYFNDLNQGAKVTLPAFGKKTGEAITAEFEIFAYNGGLFHPDEILDTIKIDDTLLYNYTQKMSHYNFDSDVDVNILGHIFENSLNEIDEIKSEIEGNVLDKTKTRRKKDGVFYTPKYITKYIVDNTVGKLCSEKKIEIQLQDEDYVTDKKLQTKTKKALLDKLTDYRSWLLQLTICDPACGSGAFLNQALEFLIAEHRYIDELQAKLMGDAMILSDIENSILENNIYGVDLNDESVEIAKLSLWLRTAQKGRKLNSLNNNIKCGNSLIDVVEVAGDKAFSWEKEFPEVFAKGGFDVIIGNPPYGAELNENEKKHIELNFKSFEYQVNTYVIFYEKGIEILNTEGLLGFITPATFTYQHYFKKIRNIFSLYSIQTISKYYYEVFDDADIGDSVSWIISKKKNIFSDIKIQLCRNKIDAYKKEEIFKYKDIVQDDGTYNLSITGLDNKKIYRNCINNDDTFNIIVGIKPYQVGKGTPKQDREIVTKKTFTSNEKVNDTYIQCVIGKDFHRYKFLKQPQMYLSYGKWLAEPRESAPFFNKEKIIIRQTADSIIAHLDCNSFINLNNVYNIGTKNSEFDLKYILALLNSKFINFIYQDISQEQGRLFAEVKKVNLLKLPLKKIKKEYQKPYVDKVSQILILNTDYQKINEKFTTYFSKQYQIEKLSGTLEKWYELEFVVFIKELNKAIKGVKGTPLTKKDEFEWIDLFEENKQKVLSLKAEIDKTDKEIDHMVYALYELTEEEIKIVEGI